MKIALLTDGITPYVIGGMQRHSFYLAQNFARNGIYVDLYHFNQSSLTIDDLLVFTDEEKKYIRSIVIGFPKLDSFPGHYIRESYKYSELIFDKLILELKNYDFIYSKGFTSWKLLKEKNKGLKCPPIGVNFHGYEMFQFAPDFKVKLQHYLLRRPVKWININSDFVFSYGGKISDIINSLGVDRDKIIEVPTGIEEEWLNDTALLKVNEKRKFVFVGRNERRKGIKELNEVLLTLSKERDDFEFDFIGFIEENEKIKDKKITYHGPILESSAIRSILREKDVLVCPSYSEGMPNVIIEAMASGLAIISTDVGAINLMVSEKNGIFVPIGDVLFLKKAFDLFISLNDQELLKMKKESIFRSEHFLWKNVIKGIIMFISKLANE